MSRCRIVSFVLVTTCLCCALSAPAQKYSFGLVKRTVTLQRRLLPDIELKNVSLAVVFDRGSNGIDANAFSADLETLLAENGSSIRLVRQSPQYEIRCFATLQRPAITTQTENKVTTRSAYGEATIDVRVVRMSDDAAIRAFSEKAILSASSNAGGLLKLPTFSLPGLPGFHKSQPSGDTPPPAAENLASSDTEQSLTAKLTRRLAQQVASHLTPTNESIPVLLAVGGSLDAADKLAQQGRWTEYLEALQAAPPAPTPADDAYRLYDLGVANEALGYAASSPKITLKFLEQASINYSKAAEARPEEKYFGPAQKRIETAIVRYTDLRDNTKQLPTDTAVPASKPAGAAQAEALTNADIIKLVQARVPHAIVMSKINSAPNPQFDLSTDALIALTKAGVPGDMLQLMTQRMSNGAAQPVHR